MKGVVFWTMAGAAVLSAWRVFRADSMVRAAYWLMASFVAVGIILVLLRAEFLGLVLLLMMAGEMTIMAVFMVMFMMNPAGLNPMRMVHQHRTAILAGVVAFLGLGAVGMVGRFPDRPAPASNRPTEELGTELLGDSMLIFESAGVALLATMIGALAIASRRGRFGVADDGSLEPDAGAAAPAAPAPTVDEAEDEHAGHAMGSGMAPGGGTVPEGRGEHHHDA
jgi:NADH:ubiquinone oxidoreductase subunit 6 (subunit J)